METKSPDRSTLVAFFLTVLFAGNNAIAVKFSNADLPPFFGAASRFAAAAIILFALVLILRLALPRGRGLQGALIYGTLNTGINYALLYWALQYIQPGLSMVILALTPLLTFLFAWAHRQEAFQWKSVAGAILALVGIGIIAWDQLSASAPLLPILAVALAAACFAESSVLIKTYPKTHPITTNAVSLLTGAILLFIFSLLGREVPVLPTQTSTWVALAYLVVFGTVATFVLSLYVLKRWTASASSYVFVLMPVVTIISSALLIGEVVTLPFILGTVFVLGGTYIGGIARTEQLKRVFSGGLFRQKASASDC